MPFIRHSKKVRPDQIGPGDEIIVVKLAGISPERIVRVLNVLEQDLRRGRHIDTGSLLFEEVKQRILSAVERYADVLKEIGIYLLKK
ncbi:MAG: hypothetical protein HY347_11360 [candidate division NC10 bacterium]|nr:hypothetical protein [candidate division NC10 bacterium]